MRERGDFRRHAVLRQGARDLSSPYRGPNQTFTKSIGLPQLKAYSLDRIAVVGRRRLVAEGMQNSPLVCGQIFGIAGRETPQQIGVVRLGRGHATLALRGGSLRVEAQHLVD